MTRRSADQIFNIMQKTSDSIESFPIRQHRLFFVLYNGAVLRQVQAVRERSPFFRSQSFRGGFRIVSDEHSVPTNSTGI